MSYEEQWAVMPAKVLTIRTAWFLMTGVLYTRTYENFRRDFMVWEADLLTPVKNYHSVIYPMHKHLKEASFILGVATYLIDDAHINTRYSWVLMQRMALSKAIIGE